MNSANDLHYDSITKAALNYSLGEMLDASGKECVLFHFGFKYKIYLDNNEHVSAEEVRYVLRDFFHEGASLFVAKFDEKYVQLMQEFPRSSSQA